MECYPISRGLWILKLSNIKDRKIGVLFILLGDIRELQKIELSNGRHTGFYPIWVTGIAIYYSFFSQHKFPTFVLILFWPSRYISLKSFCLLK